MAEIGASLATRVAVHHTGMKIDDFEGSTT
jgi:hypothetical protein